MASACVFPGGAAEEGEDAPTAAARELFEEAGVLLAKKAAEARNSDTLVAGTQDGIRQRILRGTPASSALAISGLQWSTEALVPWSHWITPSVETKRFSARFFV